MVTPIAPPITAEGSNAPTKIWRKTSGTAVIFIQGQGEEFAVKSIKVHGSCNLTYNVVNSVEGLGKLSGELPAREYYINKCKYSQVRKITVITNKGSSDFTFSN